MTQAPFPDPQLMQSAQAVWGWPLECAACSVCQQAHLAEAAQMGQPCPICANGKLTRQPARLRAEPPEQLIPLRKTRNDVQIILANFAQGFWLSPADFQPAKLAQRARPVFWPMWLVDADAVGSWHAEVGFDYQVKSSQEAYQASGWQTREVIETRVRWEPRVGQVARQYDNVAVPALSQQAAVDRLLGAYRLAEAVPYSATHLNGAAVRVPDLHPETAWPQAEVQLREKVEADCEKAATAQHIRQLNAKLHYNHLHWTQLLLPMYVTYYTDDEGKVHPIYINGQTGTIGGARIASQRQGWMWAGALGTGAAGLLVIGVFLALLGLLFPPIAVLGALFFGAALITGAVALIPALWPWQWNRTQRALKVW